MTRDQHLFGPGPKRVLALDGGGVLGIVEIAFLERIEATLRAQHGDDPAFRLSDYFDLIGGTSTGSIIATCLALGATVAEVRDLYFDLAPRIFGRERVGGGLVNPVYDLRALVASLQYHLQERTLGCDDLMTGLAIVAKRLDTASAWVLLNSSRWMYWDDKVEDDPATGKPRRRIGNRHYLLRELVRASAAVPLYFEPQNITIAERPADPHRNLPEATETGTFVDGGLTPHNNPSLQMLMLARMAPYGLNWRVGPNELLVVSIGRGWRRPKLDESGGWIERLMPQPVWFAYRSLLGLSRDCSVETIKILQWLSEPDQPWHVNSEVRSQQGDLLLCDSPRSVPRELLRFQRYDVDLPAELDDFVEPDVMQPAYKIAQTAADGPERGVKPAHFPDAFNLMRQRAEPPAVLNGIVVDRCERRPAPFIVGVTGHRWNRLPQGELERIKLQLAAALAEIECGHAPAAISLMSGLAEGSDRMVAKLALARGWHLIALLPFSRAQYQRDFQTDASKKEFDELCARSITVLETPLADSYAERNHGYAAQGRALVDAVSALVTVWDGKAPHGTGGTAEAIALALAKGIPVYWIDTAPGAELTRM